MPDHDLYRAALMACQVAEEKKGENVALLDLRQRSTVADYFVVITSRSGPHAKAISEAVMKALDDFPLRRRGVEGYPRASWILLDYYGVVVHVMSAEERDYYNLERFWSGEGLRTASGINFLEEKQKHVGS